MDKDILESVMKRNWRMSSTEKIISVESVPAVGKDVNFMSTVDRLNIKVVLGNGKVVNKSLVMKTPAGCHEFLADMNAKYETFKTEVMIYNMLTQLEHLMEEFDDTEDVLWCKMVHHVPYDLIVMEDLKASGFQLIGKGQFFDLDHILLIVHSLGRYHGMFKILEGRGMNVNGFKPCFVIGREKIRDFMYADLMGLKKGISKLWNPEWKPVVEKIKITKEEIHERLTKFMEPDETKFNVTNHGDCHRNNILLKYNWDKRPIAVRFVDFQLPHYGSPCIDLTYLLHLTLNPNVRRDNLDLLLKTYHKGLVDTLDKYQYQAKKPSLEDIKDDMEKHFFMGSMLSLTWYMNMIHGEKLAELRNHEKVLATEGEEGYADEYFNPLFEKDIGPDIIAFVERFC